MNAYNGKLVSGGRLQLPAAIRRALGLADGDWVVMRVVTASCTCAPAATF